MAATVKKDDGKLIVEDCKTHELCRTTSGTGTSGVGMGFREFYFDDWEDALNRKYSGWCQSCNYSN